MLLAYSYLFRDIVSCNVGMASLAYLVGKSLWIHSNSGLLFSGWHLVHELWQTIWSASNQNVGMTGHQSPRKSFRVRPSKITWLFAD